VSGFLIDTSVLLDVAERDPLWLAWSREALETASNDGLLAINPVIYAEFSLAYATIEQLDAVLSALNLELRQIPRPALFLQHGNSATTVGRAVCEPAFCRTFSSAPTLLWSG
jgi:hypothetical protein